MTTKERETLENEQANIARLHGYLAEYRRAMSQAARARHAPNLKAEFLTIAGFRLADIEKCLSDMPISCSQEQENATEKGKQEHVSYRDALARLQSYLDDYDQNRKLAHLHGSDEKKTNFFQRATDHLTTFHEELLALLSAHKNKKILLE